MSDILNPAPYEDAVAWVDAYAALPGEEVAAADAAGRVLAAPVVARGDHPPTALAALDGFALQAAASVGASEYNPLTFRLAAPGAPRVSANEALATASGEPLPAGADSVIPGFDTDVQGEVLDVYAPVAPGDNVVPAGREARDGEQVLAPGRVLRPADSAWLVAAGVAAVPVARRPGVGIVVVRGDAPDATGSMIRALVSRDGGLSSSRHPHPDDGGLAQVLAGTGDDLLLVIGGSGMGANDAAAAALAEAGEVSFRGVAINPGESATLGRVGETPVVVLPGPPLAALFAYDALAGRAVRRLGGREPGWPYAARRAVLSGKIASGLGLLEYCRVRVRGDGAEPLAVSDNRTLSTAVHADGFVLVPPSSEGFAEGTEVTVHLYDQRF